MNRHEPPVHAGPTPWETTGLPHAEEGPGQAASAAIAAARRHAVPLGLWVLACILAGAWFAHATPPSYTATASILLDTRQRAVPSYDSQGAAAADALDSAQADSQLQVIRSERLLASVFSARGLSSSPELAPGPPGLRTRLANWVASRFGIAEPPPPSPPVARSIAFANFVGRVGARRVGTSYVMEESYTSSDPDAAQQIANAIVAAYLGQQVAIKSAQAGAGIEFLQPRATALAAEVESAKRAVSEGHLPDNPMPDADARVIGAALLPLSRSAPQTGLIIAFMGAFGLLAGLFVVTVRNGFDRRIRTPQQIWHEARLECLGTVPDVGRWGSLARGRSADARRTAAADERPDGRFAAAIRDVRTALTLDSGGDERHRTIALVSWDHGAGTTLVACNLARVMASSGLDVALVDADIKGGDASLTSLSGLPATGGLTDALLDEVHLADITLAELAPRLGLVASRTGGAAPDPRAFLGAPAMPTLLKSLAKERSVVIDLPPLKTSSDARVVASMVDGVVIVAEAGRTTREDIEQVRRALKSTHILGVVLNRHRD